MNKFVLVALGLASMIAVISGHGQMVQPPNRGVAWRYLPDHGLGVNWFTEEWCGKVKDLESRVFRDSNSRNATCGIGGPIYNGNPAVWSKINKQGKVADVCSLEVQSPIYTGISVANYTKGALIDVKLAVRFQLNLNYNTV